MMNVVEVANKCIHFFCGMLAAIFLLIPNGWALTFALTYGFIRYQVNEQHQLLKHNKFIDHAFEEIQEYVIGLCVGGICLILHIYPINI